MDGPVDVIATPRYRGQASMGGHHSGSITRGYPNDAWRHGFWLIEYCLIPHQEVHGAWCILEYCSTAVIDTRMIMGNSISHHTRPIQFIWRHYVERYRSADFSFRCLLFLSCLWGDVGFTLCKIFLCFWLEMALIFHADDLARSTTPQSTADVVIVGKVCLLFHLTLMHVWPQTTGNPHTDMFFDTKKFYR